MKKKSLLLAVVVVLGGLICPAQGAVTWLNDTIIASGDQVDFAHLKMCAYDVGAVDLAWQAEDDRLRYSNVVNGSLVVDAESPGRYSHAIMGISRDGGVVRIGVNDHQKVVQSTRTGPGTWDHDFAYPDPVLDTLAAPAGGYDVDPTTGLGGFLYKEASTDDIVYVQETAGGTWSKTVLDNSANASYGRYNDLVYSESGVPIGAYATDAPVVRAGKITGPGPLPLKPGVPAYGWMHLDIAVAPDDTIYLLDWRHTSATDLWIVDDDTWTWSGFPSLTGDFGGDNKDVAVAVAPDESLIAALVLNKNTSPDPDSPVLLYTSADGGATWDWDASHILPGATLGIADVAFDSASNLYVGYYNATADELHLLSTVPEPATLSLLALGSLAWLRKRRL